MPDRRQWFLRLSLLGTIAAGFFLRLFLLGHQELRGDEAFGYFFSQQPLARIVSATWALQEPHPVASYFIQHFWMAWAGQSEFALRFISAAFGTLAVAALYRLGRQINLSAGAALLAAVMLALSPYAIWHSQDARMYAISLALTIISTWLIVQALQRRSWPVWGAYLAVTWLALHTHYFTAFIVLAQNIFVLSRLLLLKRERPVFVPWLIVQALLLAAWLPWLIPARTILGNYGGNGDSPGLWQMLVRAQSAFMVGETMPAGQRLWFAGFAAALLCLGAASLAVVPGQTAALSRRWALWLLVLYLVVPLGITWVSAQSRPIFNERYLMAVVPPFFLLVASGIVDGYRTLQLVPGLAARARTAWPAVASALLLLWLVAATASLQNYLYDPAYSKTRGWRELAAVMDRLAVGLDAGQVRLVGNYPDPTFGYYYRGPVAQIVLPPQPNSLQSADQEVANLVASGVKRLVLAVQPAARWDATGIAGQALARQYGLTAETQVGVWPLQVYSRPDAGNLQPVDIQFANGLQLTGIALEPANDGAGTVPGGLVIAHLQWQGAADLLTGDEKLFLHLVDATGHPLAQHDQTFTLAQPPGSVASYGIPLPATLPPGTYRLLGGIYDPGVEGSPRVLTTRGHDTVELGTITVQAAAP